MQRFGLRDDQWERIKDLLPGREGHVGGNAAAYDADPFVETLTQRGITPVIPPKANRNIKRECDFALYCERNLVERFFNLLKHFCAIATRYDKLARNFLAGVQLAAVTILLN
jgi:transposase